MPTFRFNKAFNIGQKAKVFLNLQGGVTRGAVPSPEQLSDAQRRISQQKKMLKNGEREIFRLKNELRAAEKRPEGTAEIGALPDFVIIGAQKCGTSSLYRLLARHPNVERAASKEVHYFDNRFDEGTEWYRSQFPSPKWKEGWKSITGEASPYYLFHPHAARRMVEVIRRSHLIVLLRNPVDRAYSHYHHEVRKGCETLKFEEAIEAEEARLRGERDKMLEDEHYSSFNYRHFSYLQRGIYVDQLLHWSRFFSREQMLVLKSEDFFEREPETLKIVLDFLDLPDWEPENLKIRNKGRYEGEMDPATRRQLEDFFEPHNRRLYEYLGMDFRW